MKLSQFKWWTLLLVSALTLTTVHAQNCGTSRRRPWRALSCQEQDRFLNALQEMKQSGVYDELANVHWTTGGSAHRVPAFLPWHRYYIAVFERELQRVGGCGITLPYWDWDRGGSIPTILRANTFGSPQGGCVSDGVAANWRPESGGNCLQRDFNNRFSLSRDVEVLSRITNSRDYADFRSELEGAPHTAVHSYVGGLMVNTFSSDDPLFWLHHSNVDRIWTLWQNYNGHHNLSPDEYGREHYNDDLDAPLQYRGDRGNHFGGRVTARDMLSNSGNRVNVQYLDDNLARSLVQTSGQFADIINEGWNRPGLAGEACNGNNQGFGGGGGNNNNGGDNNNGGGENNGNNNPQDEDEDRDRGNCRDTGANCNRNGHCCSSMCRQGRCFDPNDNPQQAGEESDEDEDEPPQTCRDRGGNCNRSWQCCSSVCWQGRCWAEEEEEEDDQTQTCRAEGEDCNRNRHCCSRDCREGSCWDPTAQQQQQNNNCRGTEQQCNRNGQCCSGVCWRGSCRQDASADDSNNGGGNHQRQPQGQNQNQNCQAVNQGCNRNRHCCSRWCVQGTCRSVEREDEDEGNNGQQQTCAALTESCNSGGDCCSRRCRNGRCAKRNNNQNLRRTTTTANDYWQLEEQETVLLEPEFFSSPEIDARWQELLRLFGRGHPDIIFSILGSEDCANRTIQANQKIESASEEWIQQSKDLTEETVRVFDCHYVIPHHNSTQ